MSVPSDFHYLHPVHHATCFTYRWCIVWLWHRYSCRCVDCLTAVLHRCLSPSLLSLFLFVSWYTGVYIQSWIESTSSTNTFFHYVPASISVLVPFILIVRSLCIDVSTPCSHAWRLIRWHGIRPGLWWPRHTLPSCFEKSLAHVWGCTSNAVANRFTLFWSVWCVLFVTFFFVRIRRAYESIVCLRIFEACSCGVPVGERT